MFDSTVSIKAARKMYRDQKSSAKERDIPFLLDFVEWLVIWDMSGKLDDRGRLKGQYVMARKGDIGPYAWWNVDIIQCGENVSQAQVGRKIPASVILKRLKTRKTRRFLNKKLMKSQILEIRSRYIKGSRWCNPCGMSFLAKEYGVGIETIKNIIHRKEAYVLV